MFYIHLLLHCHRQVQCSYIYLARQFDIFMECTWHHKTFMQLYWHLAIKVYCLYNTQMSRNLWRTSAMSVFELFHAINVGGWRLGRRSAGITKAMTAFVREGRSSGTAASQRSGTVLGEESARGTRAASHLHLHNHKWVLSQRSLAVSGATLTSMSSRVQGPVITTRFSESALVQCRTFHIAAINLKCRLHCKCYLPSQKPQLNLL